MTTLTNDSAVTRIAAVWRGYKIRQLFREASSVDTWGEFDEMNLTALTDSQYVDTWTIGLRISEMRLINQWDYEDDRQQMCYAGDEDTTDWWWNDGGGYADW